MARIPRAPAASLERELGRAVHRAGPGAGVTGYATSSISGRTSGAVSVELNGGSAARIDQIVEGLPRANLEYICAENSQEYHITFCPRTA